jgi:hypothetical protein
MNLIANFSFFVQRLGIVHRVSKIGANRLLHKLDQFFSDSHSHASAYDLDVFIALVQNVLANSQIDLRSISGANSHFIW